LNLGDSTKFEEALGGVLVCAWLRWRVYAGQSMRQARQYQQYYLSGKIWV
jgi:hypothetical protein